MRPLSPNYWLGSRQLAPRMHDFDSWNEITLQDFFEITLRISFSGKYQVSSSPAALLHSTFNPLCWQMIDQTTGASFQLLSKILIHKIIQDSRFNIHVMLSCKFGFPCLSSWSKRKHIWFWIFTRRTFTSFDFGHMPLLSFILHVFPQIVPWPCSCFPVFLFCKSSHEQREKVTG